MFLFLLHCLFTLIALVEAPQSDNQLEKFIEISRPCGLPEFFLRGALHYLRSCWRLREVHIGRLVESIRCSFTSTLALGLHPSRLSVVTSPLAFYSMLPLVARVIRMGKKEQSTRIIQTGCTAQAYYLCFFFPPVDSN